MSEEKILESSEDWNKQDQKLSYKEIVLRHLQVCVNNTSKEMRSGFWIYNNPGPNRSPEKLKYVGDSRKVLFRSLDCLHDLLLPKFDEDIKAASKTFHEEVEAIGESNQEKPFLAAYRKLFQAICLFLERLQWLEVGGIED